MGGGNGQKAATARTRKQEKEAKLKGGGALGCGSTQAAKKPPHAPAPLLDRAQAALTAPPPHVAQ